jgi:hypothetical protein
MAPAASPDVSKSKSVTFSPDAYKLFNYIGFNAI